MSRLLEKVRGALQKAVGGTETLSMQRFIFHLWLLVVGSLSAVRASSGDRGHEFRHCVNECVANECGGGEEMLRLSIPSALQLLGWTCEENCKYECMQQITQATLRKEPGSLMYVHQYYGKWPFLRFHGLQEPASIVFSIGNLIAQYYGRQRVLSEVPSMHPMRNIVLTNSLIYMNTWVWSSIFHARDFAWTERMDYFSAIASILFAWYAGFYRIFIFSWQNIHPQTKKHLLPPHSNLLATMVACGATCFFMGHVYYLSVFRFDYAYNLIAGAVVGISHNLLWAGFCVKLLISERRRYAWKGLLATVGMTLAISLELMDFPPLLGLIDAHSLWHLSTIPLCLVWYDFMICDGQWECNLFQQKQKQK